jgi:DNA-binding HxlR family transcriptional regulator
VPPDDPPDAPNTPNTPKAPNAGEPTLPHDGLAEALALVGDRWTLLIVAALLEGPRRFGDLQADVDGIAPNVLTQRLRTLTQHGLVIASAYTERPPRFVYELSAGARELALPLQLLAGWGSTHAPGAQAPRHEVCGTPLELEWWCPVCRQTVPDAEPSDADDDLHYA